MNILFKWASYVLASVVLLSSCTKDDPKPNDQDTNPNLTVIHDTLFSGSDLRVKVYAQSELIVGHNTLYFMVTDSAGNTQIQPNTLSFSPLMEMATMSHACPYTPAVWDGEVGGFVGSIVFIMPSGMMGSWFVDVDLSVNGENLSYQFSPLIAEPEESRLKSFVDTATNTSYFVALIQPTDPKVGMNDYVLGVYKRENMMNFPPVEGMQIEIEPEMPTMQHGSPNNVNPVDQGDGLYVGQVNFTMTGYWRVNMIIRDGENNLVTDNVYFDITF